MTPSDLALVVPCYNEAARLDPEAFLDFAATHPGVRLLMVDDSHRLTANVQTSADAFAALLSSLSV